jgi:tetratricopeptide (TPR) repeat protein
VAVEAETSKKILIVDDDASVANTVEKALERYNISVVRAMDLETAFYLFTQNRFDAVLVELEFAPLPGLALIQKWRIHENRERRSTPFIVISGQSRDVPDEALISELGDVEILNKPLVLPQLLGCLGRSDVTKKRMSAYEEFKEKVLSHYTDAGKFDRAAEVVRKNLYVLGTRGLEILYDLYEKADRFEDALNIVNQMLETKSTDISLINAKGRLLLRLKKYDEAAVCLEKADGLAPGKIDRINAMAGMYLSLDRPKDSVKKFQEVLDLSPENPDLKFEMFSRLYECGFDHEAIEFGKKSASPIEIVRHYNNRGVLLSKGGNTAQALIEYERALKFYPKFRENYRIYFNMAVAHTFTRSREDFLRAEVELQRCLELAPEFDKAIKKLEMVQKALKRAPGG